MDKPLKYGLFLILAITGIIFVFNSLFIILGGGYFLIFASAVISAIIISATIILTTPFLKDILATYRTMMRLENLSHPLLIELSLETPGTYQHSLMVASLAHRAAKAIGANSLLARIGGYYHDIGKIKNPEYFIENQSFGVNPHTELNNPQKSARIIMHHVFDGVKMAHNHNIPKEIIDLIEQHHGTTTVNFFYDLAKSKSKNANKNDFRYPGPKPLSLESAILMLADAIEAKIRLCNKITPLIIRETVDDVINMRMHEHQLDFSNLDNEKRERVRLSFIDTLSTMFHQRIKYPGDVKNAK